MGADLFMESWYNEDKLRDKILEIRQLHADLAAARARIAELEAANAWVSVEERLPDHSNAVMAVTNTDYMEIAYWDNRFHKWRWLDDDKTADDVTHWHSLLPPPEAK